MRRLLPILGFLLLTSPCWATWTCAQGATGCTVTTTRDCTATATSCNITVSSTHAHAAEALCAAIGSTSVTLSASASDGGFTVATGSKGVNGATAGTAECSYNLNATGGATTINCPVSSSSAIVCIFFEFTGTGSSFTFDVAGTAVDTTCTSCTGAALATTTANNYILIQASSCGGTCSAINQSYTGVFVTGDGGAFKINVSSAGTTPAWTMTSSVLAGSGIALYEITGGAAACQSRALMGVGC